MQVTQRLGPSAPADLVVLGVVAGRCCLEPLSGGRLVVGMWEESPGGVHEPLL